MVATVDVEALRFKAEIREEVPSFLRPTEERSRDAISYSRLEKADRLSSTVRKESLVSNPFS